MVRPLVALAVVLALVGATAVWQWRAAANRLDLDRWQLDACTDAPFVAEGLARRMTGQICWEDRAHLEFFFRLWLMESADPAEVQARVFVPGHVFGDLAFHDERGRRTAFRLSRAPGVPSGFRAWEGETLAASHEIAVPAATVTDEAIDPATRLRLLIWSYNEPRTAFPAVADEGLGRWFDLRLRETPGGVEALVDGESTGVWPGVRDLRAPIGVQAGDLPCLHIDEITAWSRDGTRLWREDFAPSGAATVKALGRAGLAVLALALAWLIAVALARVAFPGADQPHLAERLARGLLPLALLPWLGWLRGSIEDAADLCWWWLFAGAATGLVWLGFVFAERRHFRWKWEGWEPCPPPARRALIALLSFAVLIALVSLAIVFGRPSHGASVQHERAISSPVVLGPGAHFRSRSESGRNGSSVTARIRLLEPGTCVELYAMEGPHDEFAPGQGVRDWYALRLSDEAAQSGLVASDAIPAPGETTLRVGEWESVTLLVLGDRVEARRLPGLGESETWATLRDRRFERGSLGFVVRSGRAEVHSVEFLAVPPEGPRPELWTALVHLWRGTTPERVGALLALLLAGVSALLLFQALVMALAAAGAVRPVRLMRHSAVLWFISAALALAVHVMWRNLDPALWSRSLTLWLSLGAGLALHWLLWLLQGRGVRQRHMVSLLFLVTLVAVTERILRATPARFTLRSANEAGYVRNLFPFDASQADRLWMTYTGEYQFPGREGWNEPVPFDKPNGTTRIFCLGGSSTFGVGVASPEDSYPEILENLLLARGVSAEVFNAGQLGATVFHHLLALRRDLLRLSPDVLTLYAGANDGYLAWWLGGEGLEERWRRLTAITDGDHLARLGLWLADQRTVVGLGQLLGGLRPFPSRLAVQVPLERFEANLRDIAATCREHGIRLVLAHEVMAQDLWLAHPTHEAYHDVLDRLGAELGVPVVDPRPRFRRHVDDAWMVDTVHPSAAGNRALAEMFADAVLRTVE